MDAGEAIYMWIGRSVSDQFLQMVFDCKSFQELPDHSVLIFVYFFFFINILSNQLLFKERST
jgi:hypothetical protein